jgi:hypothetical protein
MTPKEHAALDARKATADGLKRRIAAYEHDAELLTGGNQRLTSKLNDLEGELNGLKAAEIRAILITTLSDQHHRATEQYALL